MTLYKTIQLSCLLFLCIPRLYSQVTISGTVADSSGKPIASASVTLQKANSNLIVAFAITNTKGQYSISYQHPFVKDSLVVKVNTIGFIAQTKSVLQAIAAINFTLKEGATILPHVTVKNSKPILSFKEDTLSYRVDSFTNKQDRTIGDVLRKMPGIDVDASGKISYNGKAISNFYIDGDNLLDDKYNIATNNIAANMVKDVQVLENHQPIRVLKNATISDKVGINLNLKDKARVKLTGRAELGAGVVDNVIYDESANIMAFKKRYKAINALKTNNTGVDISNDVVSHNIMDYLNQLENDVPNKALGLNYPGNPSVSEQRYLFNNAALVNTNNLYKTKKDLQIKTNIYYLHDKQTQNYQYNSFYYLPTDTIAYLQQQHAETQFNNVYAQVTLTSNKDKGYINNKLLFTYNYQPATSLLNTNGKYINQSLLQNTTNISNEFNSIQTKHKTDVVELYSYIGYLSKPENLHVQPGLNPEIFNNNINYRQLSQTYNVPSWFTNNYIAYRHPTTKILQAYKIGFTSQWQQLQSNVSANQINNTNQNIGDSFTNNLQWQHQKIYANADYDWIFERLKLSIGLPLNWQHIQYKDAGLKTNVSFQQLFVNPSVNLKYATGIENYITAHYNFSNNLASIQDVYQGNILNNFNLLSTNAIPIKQVNSHYASLGFNFRKTIKIFFFNIGLTYSGINSNTITQSELLQTIQKQTTIPFNNGINSYRVYSGLSKYLFKWHTTVSLKANVELTQWNQLQNNVLLDYNNITTTVSGTISPKISSWLNMLYSGTYLISGSKAKLQNAVARTTTQWHHQGEVNIIPNDNLFIKLKLEDFVIAQSALSTNTNYLFTDLSLRYKLNKLKTDIAFEVLNIANTKEYATINLSANNFSQSIYAIRPRQFLLKFLFNF
ncbi:MAG: carboxypeptidase-like regulatory domain-containing protein [Flavobacterium sp.]|nr:carboxypeptidase-like regulatory domain-containing protein [Flavobacterium sp.]